jgi:hypothetical protein
MKYDGQGIAQVGRGTYGGTLCEFDSLGDARLSSKSGGKDTGNLPLSVGRNIYLFLG